MRKIIFRQAILILTLSVLLCFPNVPPVRCSPHVEISGVFRYDLDGKWRCRVNVTIINERDHPVLLHWISLEAPDVFYLDGTYELLNYMLNDTSVSDTVILAGSNLTSSYDLTEAGFDKEPGRITVDCHVSTDWDSFWATNTIVSENIYPVHNSNTSLNYQSIQEAIDAPETLNGHTIFVEEGTYYENVVVNKAVSLIGESRDTTIIDGNAVGNVMNITASQVNMNGFTIKKGGGPPNCGIYIDEKSRGNNISHNTITNNYCGIKFINSSGNILSGNNITYNSEIGILLVSDSNGNHIIGNTITRSWNGIILGSSSNNFVSDNTVRNSESEGIFIEGSSNNTFVGNIVIENIFGFWLTWYCENNTISNNVIINNQCAGIGLHLAERNVIRYNNVTYNHNAIRVYASPNNFIYHNNFVNNTLQVQSDNASDNVWDDGYPSGGNYWSDYVGVDVKNGPNQDLLGSDGIGDTPYIIDENNQDSYPLMKPWTLRPTTYTFPIIWGEETFIVSVESNSTVSDFSFNQPNREISFNVSGSVDAIGFCNVTIPKALLYGEPWTMLIDDTSVPATIIENETHSFLYFTYAHSAHEIQIIGTWVIEDTTPPLITTIFQEPPVENVVSGQEVAVFADIIDAASGVKNVILAYSIDDDITWYLSMLYNATIGLYVATIPGFPSGTNVSYKIITYDYSDNVVDTDSLGYYFIYTVIPFPHLTADINNDGIVDMQDISIAARAFGSSPGHERWNPDADVNDDKTINLRDVAIIARHFGETQP